jgi:hypothetical protein
MNWVRKIGGEGRSNPNKVGTNYKPVSGGQVQGNTQGAGKVF